MKKAKLSKILILVLAVALICTGLVLAVSADSAGQKDTVHYIDKNSGAEKTGHLKQAVENAKEGTTVTLLGNCEYKYSDDNKWGMSVSNSITFDLNGYTITSTNSVRMFSVQTYNKTFTITGSGTINLESGSGPFIQVGGNPTEASHENMLVKVIGTGKGITINHKATGIVIQSQVGNFELKNVKINTATTSNVFNSGDIAVGDKTYPGKTCFKLEGVEINATAEVSGKTVFNLRRDTATLSMNYCNITTKSHSLIGIPNDDAKIGGVVHTPTTKLDDYIVVNNSYINVGKGGTLIYGYPALVSDIKFLNSYVSWNEIINIKANAEGTALIFDNCDVNFANIGGTAFRATMVKLINGSTLSGIYASIYDTGKANTSSVGIGSTMTVNGVTGIYMLLEEGTRFDKVTYDRIMAGAGYKAGTIAYPDGSTPKNSETYTIIRDTVAFTDTPYVVVKAEDAAAAKSEIDGTVQYWSNSMPDIWNFTGTPSMVNSNQNTYFKWVSNGKKYVNSSGKETGSNLIYKLGTGISASTKGVFVMDLDITSDSEVGYAFTNINLHARTTPSGGTGDADASYGSFIRIYNDGSIYLSVNKGDGTKNDNYVDTGIDLAFNEWNHITIVVDNATGEGYIYVNGQYVGSHKAYDTGAYIFGPRFNFDVSLANANTGTSLLVDNVMFRAFGDAPASTALADKGASYVINEGKPFNENTSSEKGVTIGGVEFSNVADAFEKGTELGLPVQLQNNITRPVLVTGNGIVYTNGYTMNIADGSTSCAFFADSNGASYYEFDSKYEGVTAKYQFYLSNKTDAQSLANPENWTEVAETDLKTNLENLCDKTFTVFGKYTDNGYLTSTWLGWATDLSATEARRGPITADEALSGEVVKIYPVFSFAKEYAVVILDANGEFSRGFTPSDGVLWGTAMNKYAVKYGETFVLNRDIIAQVSLSNIFGVSSAAPNNASCTKTADGATEEKYIGIDFNGYTLKVDTNHSQDSVRDKATFLHIYEGEQVNVYSSREGGKLEMYGLVNNNNVYDPSGGAAFAIYGSDADGIAASANGEVTKNNTKVNIGTVTVAGKEIPGANLTIETCVITDIDRGDSTCEVNIDGITATRNSVDYSGMFIIRKYFGKLNITNSTIINAVNNEIIDGHKHGYSAATGERALADVLFDNCLIIVKDNYGDVVNKDYSLGTLTFRNCTTNGKLVADEFAALVLGVGNKAADLYSTKLEDGVVVAKWNNYMELSGNTVTVPYFSVIDQDFSGTGEEYNYHTIVFADYLYNGTADVILPVLTEATILASDAVKVTRVDVQNNKTEYLYAKGGNVVLDAPADYVGEVISGSFKNWKIDGVAVTELPKNITEDVTVNVDYEFVANISGMMTNLSLYSDFKVNLYVPAAYADAITAINGVALDETTVTVGGAQYIKVSAYKVAKDAATAAIFEINVTEGGFEATKTVRINIVDYAATILGGEYSESEKTLMVYMLNYVYAAEYKFYGTENSDIAALISERYNYEFIAKNYENEAIENTNLDAIFTSASVVLGEVPTFNLVLGGSFTGTVTVTYGDGATRTYNITESDKNSTIRISGMKIYNFGTTLTVTATPTEGEATVGTINFATYANYHINVNPADIEVQALIEALYEYVKVAEMYKAGTLAVTPEA